VFDLLYKCKELFSLGRNNALLEFLLEGTPTVWEQLVDSQKEVDKQLKASCEAFIHNITKSLAAPLLTFLDNVRYSAIQFRIFSENLEVEIYETMILLVLYECETQSLTLREDHKWSVFENRELRRLFRAKRDKIAREWRKLHDEELCNCILHLILVQH
jgi:hypothetical protein